MSHSTNTMPADASIQPEGAIGGENKAFCCILDALGSQLIGVNDLIEGSFGNISTEFVELTGQIDEQRALLDRLQQSPSDTDALQALQAIVSDMSSNVTHILMGMQFQDRVSQNLVIVMNILALLSERQKYHLDTMPAETNLEMAKEILALLKLGEIREVYVQHLLDRGYIHNVQELGLEEAPDTHAGEDDDIELF